ncbi:hypothetical protein [Streptomyces niveus]
MSAPTLALVEEMRGEGLAVRAAEIASTPGHPSTGSLRMYQESARRAFAAAAANAVQPEAGWEQ